MFGAAPDLNSLSTRGALAKGNKKRERKDPTRIPLPQHTTHPQTTLPHCLGLDICAENLCSDE
ncbi:hypothetical protein E2C01_002668 [Portunus trituberculatus]|uniref:Uncharacterized protein n=1 Tax=Portunus trituberculatus TaxID=210409 RepID=A0A5B7CMS6_PORTR|nr:hypothetical protein [Portunus trituberculatus]